MTVNTGISILDAMLSGTTWAPTATPVRAMTVTYSFMTSAPPVVVGFQPISSSDQLVIEQALQTYSAVANITFTLVPGGGNADIMFGMANLNGDAGFTTATLNPPTNAQTGLISYASTHCYFDTNYGVNIFLVLHELGNATGLKDFSGLSLAQAVALGLPASEANWDYSVMATSPPFNYVPSAPYSNTPQLLDIQALQYLYGANEHGCTAGATPTSTGLVYSFTTYNTPQCIWVGKKVFGKTTFDFSGCTESGPVTINLSAGSFSSTGVTQPSNPGNTGLVNGQPYNNISIAYRTVIQNAVGGGSGDTTFQSGGTGHYSFTGLGTNNTLDYSADINGVTINLATHTVLKDSYPPLRYFPIPLPFPIPIFWPRRWQDKFTNIQTFIGNPSASETIYFSGASNQYSIVSNADGSVTVADMVAGRDGTVNLSNIGNLVFTDTTIRI
jgi:serralysin